MVSSFKSRVLERAIGLQGVSSFHAEASDAPLPVFSVSNRRIVLGKNSTVLERGSPTDEFEHLTVQESNVPIDHTLVVFLFEITTDFCFGYGTISLSDSSVIVLEDDEESIETGWSVEGGEYSPIIETDSRLLTRDGWEQKPV